MDLFKENFINKFVQKKEIELTIRVLSIVIGFLGIAYFFWKNLFIRWEDVDFKVIWLSGHLWLEGVSPYGPRFMELGHELFDSFNGHPFYYPPHFRLVSSFFAFWDYEMSMEIWRWINIGLFLFSSVLLKSAMDATGVNLSWRLIIFYTGLIGFMQAVVLIFHIGQTTMLIYFGICLTIFGAFKTNKIALVAGLCIVLLKPQIGVPLMAAFLPFKEYRKELILTCLLMILLSLPGTQPIGLIETTEAYIKGATIHGDFYSNQAKMTTGIRNIIYLITDFQISSTLAALSSIIAVFCMVFIVKHKILDTGPDSHTNAKVITLMLSITVIAVFSPLHTYDFVFLAPIIIMSWKFGNPFKTYLFMLFLIIVRHDNITRETGILFRKGETLVGSELVTLASMAILSIIILYLRNSSTFTKANDQ